MSDIFIYMHKYMYIYIYIYLFLILILMSRADQKDQFQGYQLSIFQVIGIDYTKPNPLFYVNWHV